VLLVAVVCGGALSCVSWPAADVASRYIKSALVSALEGGTIAVTAQESADLAGAQLAIPPNALAADTIITLELGSQPIAIAPDEPSGPVAQWGPAGTSFSRPAEITLPYLLGANQYVDDLGVIQTGAQAMVIADPVLDVHESSHQASFRVWVLSEYQPVVQACPSTIHPCPAGTRCIDSRCRAECSSVTCGPGERCCEDSCLSKKLDCPVRLCGGATGCPPGLFCLDGQCVRRPL